MMGTSDMTLSSDDMRRSFTFSTTLACNGELYVVPAIRHYEKAKIEFVHTKEWLQTSER